MKLLLLITISLLLSITACSKISNKSDITIQQTFNTQQAEILSDEEVLKSYYRDNFDTNDTSVILSDLTHDGNLDMIIIKMDNLDTASIEHDTDIILEIYTINNGRAEKIYTDYPALVVPGYRWIYLYTDSENKQYLLQYSPEMFNGYGTYHFDIFHFKQTGEKNILLTEQYEFIMNSEGDLNKEIDISTDIERFQTTFLEYKDNSITLIELGQESFSAQDYLYIIKQNDFIDVK